MLEASGGGYRIYTTRYDEEIAPATRVRRALLAEYREKLDARIAAQGINLARLARALRIALANPERDGWSFGEEHGRIDGRRLSRNSCRRRTSGVCSARAPHRWSRTAR